MVAFIVQNNKKLKLKFYNLKSLKQKCSTDLHFQSLPYWNNLPGNSPDFVGSLLIFNPFSRPSPDTIKTLISPDI